MKDPSDTRDIGPRIGSPSWIYLTVVAVAGLGALGYGLVRGLSAASLHAVAGHGLLWVLIALSLLGEFKPIVTPGKSSSDAGVASVTFCFAALLYWGFPFDIAAGVTALRGLGVRLSLDDFGTGYASLGRLRRLPVAEVKIDPSFVSGLASSPDSQVIVRSVVDLVRGLGIRSVAEGVETADVAAALLAIGCDAAQGHAFSRPLNAAAATAWLASGLPPHHIPPAPPAPAARPAAVRAAPVTSAAAPEAPGG
jgi:EAL domain